MGSVSTVCWVSQCQILTYGFDVQQSRMRRSTCTLCGNCRQPCLFPLPLLFVFIWCLSLFCLDKSFLLSCLSLSLAFVCSLLCHPSHSIYVEHNPQQSGATFGFGHLPFNLTLAHSHTLNIICTCCCDVKPKELKTKISHALSLSLYLC